MCTCATIMCYHRLQQRAVNDNHFFLLLIHIISEKNHHACFLKSTFTKREQFRTKYHYLQSLLFKKEHLNMSCGKKGTLFPFWTTGWTFGAPSFSHHLKSHVVSRNPQPCEVGWLLMIFQSPTTTWVYGWGLKGEGMRLYELVLA